MTAYYNENDNKSAAWLRELIKAGHIAAGDVDERSIEDVCPDDLKAYKQCHFFAGIGVWSYALRQSGWSDDKPVWTGSCPCQPFSTAGKRKGDADERHLWPAFFHLICESRPEYVFGEQVASKDGVDWIDTVQTDLEGLGYETGAVDTCAAGFGAPHIRQRLYWVANSNNIGRARLERGMQKCDAQEWQWVTKAYTAHQEWNDLLDCLSESVICAADDGAAERVGLLRGYGNALVAPQAQAFIASFCEVMHDREAA